jgi:glycosyltransferase involved in cell wall biosynthesis
LNQDITKRKAICVFSGLTGASAGGVQVSGRIAWNGIAQHVRRLGGSVQLIVYGEADEADLRLAEANAVVGNKRWGLIRSIALRRWRTPVICLWHLNLLPLLPFMRLENAEKVVFLHGIEAWKPQGWFKRSMLGRADRFLANSQHTWERFLSFQPQLASKPHQVVHLGVGCCHEGETPAPDPIPTVLMLGRLARSEDYKGHRQVIGAWPLVRKAIPDARLWIVGDGDLRPDLEALSRGLGLSDAVQFWGRTTEERKQELLRRSRCLAMPSQAEGFGMVYLEAMRLGRPCLVSTLDAGREVVDPPVAGLAVDPEQQGPLSEALVRLLDSGPEWQRFSKGARTRYENEFTAEKFQARVVKALFGMAKTSGA